MMSSAARPEARRGRSKAISRRGPWPLICIGQDSVYDTFFFLTAGAAARTKLNEAPEEMLAVSREDVARRSCRRSRREVRRFRSGLAIRWRGLFDAL